MKTDALKHINGVKLPKRACISKKTIAWINVLSMIPVKV